MCLHRRGWSGAPPAVCLVTRLWSFFTQDIELTRERVAIKALTYAACKGSQSVGGPEGTIGYIRLQAFNAQVSRWKLHSKAQPLSLSLSLPGTRQSHSRGGDCNCRGGWMALSYCHT